MLLTLLVGILFGGAANAAADALLRARKLPVRRRPWRNATVIGMMVALALPLAARLGWAPTFWAQLACCTLLVITAVIDSEYSIVPNELVLAGTLAGLLGALAAGHVSSALWGAVAGGLSLLLLSILQRGALGAGDVKLAAAIGAMTGFPGVVQALLLGIVFGGVGAAVLLATRIRRLHQHMPYAPYLAAGAGITLIYGPQLLLWYGRRIGIGG